ncbi:hypothetical protein SCLCIDRAFT_29107 [Scleroderma citrinum Foug A]|uniref:Uncharacterized protein n=1 Tax=Scleroderma citrinum Foug A TaxID=1036808 RepID=A0A0C3DLX9_9AGAM|nr:hypothetical protein SCLCIDRAFT_29107 [Scleroderma citrinum Foug A]
MNISVGTESIFIRTRPAAPKTDEIFKKSECWHWAPKFDTGHYERNLDLSLPFLFCFFCFLAHSQGSDVC